MQRPGFKYDETGPWIEKDPQADLDYTVHFNKRGDSWLGSDRIATAAWAIAGADAVLTKHDEVITDGVSCTSWLAAGTAGVTYTVTVHIVTTGGRTDDRSFRVIVSQR